MGNKRIKLYSPAVTQTSSIIEESFIQQSLATASRKAEPGKLFCWNENELMCNKRIKGYYSSVTKTSSIIDETLNSAITRNRFQKSRTRKTIMQNWLWIRF